MPAALSLDIVAVDMRPLIAEVQVNPKFDTGVGDGQFYAVGFRLLPRLGYEWVLVHIEHAPDCIEALVGVFGCFSLTFLLLVDCRIDSLLGLFVTNEPENNQKALRDSHPFQVALFGYRAFTDDEKTRLRMAVRLTTL
ncbi:MAG: hypothetical protein U0R19_38730 [Bryobacteraceae bacterium]